MWFVAYTPRSPVDERNVERSPQYATAPEERFMNIVAVTAPPPPGSRRRISLLVHEGNHIAEFGLPSKHPVTTPRRNSPIEPRI
jgi:hypothetical protein